MADPVSGGSYSTPDTSGGSSWLSDVGSTLGSWGSTIGSGLESAGSAALNFLKGPGGAVVGAAIPAAVGLYTAGQAQNQAKAAAGQISAAGAPAGQLGAATIGQLRGGPSVGGPLGAGIAGETGAAATLAQTAQQYGTGNLTSAQNTQVQSYVQQQRAMVDRQLANSGNLDSSARASYYQQIDNNAAVLAQQLVQGNVALSTQALGAVNNTYNSLVGNALAESGLGLDATAMAVRTAMQSDQQIAGYIQQLMSGIATGLAGGTGGTQQPGQTPGQGVGGALGQAIKGFAGGGGAVNPADPMASTPASGFEWGAGPGGSDYAPGVSAPDVTPSAFTSDPFAGNYGGIATDPTSGSPDWLGSSLDGSGLLAST